MTTWVWQDPSWPVLAPPSNMVGDRRLLEISSNGGAIGVLIESASTSDQTQLMTERLVSDIVTSSAIEGVALNPDDVRSSLQSKLNLGRPRQTTDHRVLTATDLITAVREDIDAPLTTQMLREYHRKLFAGPRGIFDSDIRVGSFRNDDEPMQIVGGAIGNPKVYYEAPPGPEVPVLMEKFCDWFNATAPGNQQAIPGLYRAALAHAWFEQIHPFDDGNGRVGRALMDRALAQAPESGLALVSMSAAMLREQKQYMSMLEGLSNKSLSAENYLDWFLEASLRAQAHTRTSVDLILERGRFYEEYSGSGKLNPRQEKTLRSLFEAGADGYEGGMTARKHGSLNQCSKATATRDLAELSSLGLLKQIGEGRSVNYQLPSVSKAMKPAHQSNPTANNIFPNIKLSR